MTGKITEEIKQAVLKEYFVDRATKAGKALLAKRGVEYYREIGRKGSKGKGKRKKPVEN